MNAAQFRKERYGLSFIIGVFLLSILLFPLGVYAAITATPIITATPASVNFSSVKLGGSSLKPVTIKNTGSANLQVGAITFTGTDLSQFSQTNDCSAPLLPKGTCTVSVTFAPTLLPYGNKSAMLNIASNDPKKPTATVKLSGQVPPPVISATPASVNLGSVKLGASSAQKVITVKNTGKSDLIINNVTTTGTDGADFSQTNNCGTILPGGSCLVNVTFTSILPFANKTAKLAFASNDPKKPTATVKLSGQVPPPVISASPMSVNLTAAALDIPSAAATVTIKNTGVSDLDLSPVTVTGTDAPLFATTDTCASTLTSGKSCTVDVTFTPDSTGKKSATLNIPSDDPKKPLVTVKLTGNIETTKTAADANGTYYETNMGYNYATTPAFYTGVHELHFDDTSGKMDFSTLYWSLAAISPPSAVNVPYTVSGNGQISIYNKLGIISNDDNIILLADPNKFNTKELDFGMAIKPTSGLSEAVLNGTYVLGQVGYGWVGLFTVTLDGAGNGTVTCDSMTGGCTFTDMPFTYTVDATTGQISDSLGHRGMVSADGNLFTNVDYGATDSLLSISVGIKKSSGGLSDETFAGKFLCATFGLATPHGPYVDIFQANLHGQGGGTSTELYTSWPPLTPSHSFVYSVAADGTLGVESKGTALQGIVMGNGQGFLIFNNTAGDSSISIGLKTIK
jgi:hypothetical protein